MIRCLLLLSCLGLGCASSKPTPAPSAVVADPPGLYGRLDARAEGTLRVHRVGMGTPVAEVVLDGSRLRLPLLEGTYVAVLRSEGEEPRRRVFAVGAEPIRIAGSFDGTWRGEDSTVGRLHETQTRWLERHRTWKASVDSDPARAEAQLHALRSEALAEAEEIEDARGRGLATLAAESMFGDGDRAPGSPVLTILPSPTDPALGAVSQFPGPVYLAMKFGDAAAVEIGQAWLDATARENPEPGARAVALYFALEAARLHAPDDIAERYGWIPSLDIEGAAMLDIIEVMFDPKRLARPGAALPAFSLVRLDDATTPFSNEDIAGEVVLLHFWATWCRPCLEQIPALEQVHASMSAQGQRVRFVSINCDEDAELARRYRAEHAPMRWTHVHVGSQDSDAVLGSFGLLGPGRLLVGPTGDILATSESLGEQLEATLTEVLR